MMGGLAFLTGLFLGSFSNVCCHRLPRDQSVVKPRSYCPRCLSPIRWYDNIPLLSYFLLGRKCRSCRSGISSRYPWVELVMGLFFSLTAWQKNTSVFLAFSGCLFVFFLLTITLIDFDHQIIPDELSLGLMGFALLLCWWNPLLGDTPWIRGLGAGIGLLAGGGLMWGIAFLGAKLFKQEALGGGDIKLMAGIGAFLGWDGFVGTLLLGSITGGLAGTALIITKKRGRRDPIPFGPFLCAGAWLSFLWPQWWVRLVFP